MTSVSTGARSRALILMSGSFLLLSLGVLTASCSKEKNQETAQGAGMDIKQEPFGVNLFTRRPRRSQTTRSA